MPWVEDGHCKLDGTLKRPRFMDDKAGMAKLILTCHFAHIIIMVKLSSEHVNELRIFPWESLASCQGSYLERGKFKKWAVRKIAKGDVNEISLFQCRSREITKGGWVAMGLLGSRSFWTD